MKKIILISVVLVLLAGLLSAKEYYKIFGRQIDFLNVMEFELQTGINKFKSSDVLWDGGYVPFKLTYGLLQNYEVSVQLPYIFAKNSADIGVDGIGDLKISQKFKFTEEVIDFPALMGGISIEIPFSGNEIEGPSLLLNTNDKVDFEIFFGGGKSFPEYKNLYLSADIGINFIAGGDRTVFDYNLGASRKLTEQIRASLELNGVKSSDFNNVFLGTGIVLQPLDTLAIKLGIPFGITNDAYSYGFVFNILNTF
jgi:hypothetical protein